MERDVRSHDWWGQRCWQATGLRHGVARLSPSAALPPKRRRKVGKGEQGRTLIAMAEQRLCPLYEDSNSKSRRVLQLVVPVEAHVLDDAVAHHDDAGFLGREALVVGEGWNVNVVALLPFESFRLVRPFPDELVLAVELHVPMQVVAF